ncbi:MAG: hypothetical protein E6Q98_25480 [Rhodospirillaceae bacterium]|nr:MAG: hypothetical protein E6Q98_25480 [Rhodospirillaceae bacterium]
MTGDGASHRHPQFSHNVNTLSLVTLGLDPRVHGGSSARSLMTMTAERNQLPSINRHDGSRIKAGATSAFVVDVMR